MAALFKLVLCFTLCNLL